MGVAQPVLHELGAAGLRAPCGQGLHLSLVVPRRKQPGLNRSDSWLRVMKLVSGRLSPDLVTTSATERPLLGCICRARAANVGLS